MPEKIIVTICSREKKDTLGLLPAIERYVGPHVQFAANVARQGNIPFFVLSGKFGLVAERQGVQNYNYRLEYRDITRLVPIISRDLSHMRVREIDFYIEPGKDSWAPYIEVLKQAAARVGTKVNEYEIEYK